LIVIGCDGIRSRIRQILLGEDNPAAHPSYSKRYCFRALVPMDQARKHLSEYRASTRFMYNGRDGHAITYPISMGKWLNVLLVIEDPDPWKTADGKHTTWGSKKEALEAFKDWHPTVRSIVELLPDELDKWGIFDMLDSPAPFYSRGSVCIAGDAAHATGPHLGAGAGFGMEDALVLSALLEAVDKGNVAEDKAGRSKVELCRDALKAYNDVRYERTQWLVANTRDACDLFHARYKGVDRDWEKFAKEITWRFHKIWEYDIDGMVKEALEDFQGKSG
jgi:salicylate hydroxylase